MKRRKNKYNGDWSGKHILDYLKMGLIISAFYALYQLLMLLLE